MIMRWDNRSKMNYMTKLLMTILICLTVFLAGCADKDASSEKTAVFKRNVISDRIAPEIAEKLDKLRKKAD